MRSFVVVLLLLLLPLSVARGQVTERALGEGTPWETKVKIIDTGVPGPTVFLLGGVHGNEPAGFRAVRQISDWPFTKGRVIAVERANHLGLKKAIRYLPGAPKGRRDLNRNFPKEKGQKPVGPLAEALWALVLETQPDWFVDLHEGYDFGKRNKKSVGSSIVASSDPTAKAVGAKMAAAVNSATVSKASKRFTVRGPPILGSIARAAFELLGVPSMIVETTKKGQSLSFRTRQQRILMQAFFADLGMYSGEAAIIPPKGPPGVIRVAVYDSTGSMNSTGPAVFNRILRAAPKIEARRINRHDIRGGWALEPFDVLVVPGGSGGSQGKALGEVGREAVRAFVEAGGGYYGSCAGAYLATANYSWSLKILDAKTVDSKHWRRGKTILDIALNEDGRRVFARSKPGIPVLYANGPILAPAENDEIPDFEVLAVYEGEIARRGAKKGVMPGTPAIVRGTFGNGRVWCSSPHPEYNAATHDMVLAGIRWLSPKGE